MATFRKQYYGIKFPFTSENNKRFFLDLNGDPVSKVVSDIIHLLLTPKGSRIRKPEFGTDILKYMFEPNDEITWEEVEANAIECVNKNIKNASLVSVKIISDEDEHRVYLALSYNVAIGKQVENNKTVVQII